MLRATDGARVLKFVVCCSRQVCDGCRGKRVLERPESLPRSLHLHTSSSLPQFRFAIVILYLRGKTYTRTSILGCCRRIVTDFKLSCPRADHGFRNFFDFQYYYSSFRSSKIKVLLKRCTFGGENVFIFSHLLLSFQMVWLQWTIFLFPFPALLTTIL